jgi:hypothetical protein
VNEVYFRQDLAKTRDAKRVNFFQLGRRLFFACACWHPNTPLSVNQKPHASRPSPGKREEWLLYAHTHPKHIRGGWSHYTDTSEPVDGYGAQNMVTVQSGFRTSDFSITG